MTAETYSVSTIHVGDNAEPAQMLGPEGGVRMFVDQHDNGRQAMTWASPSAHLRWAFGVYEGALEMVRMAEREARIRTDERSDEARYDAEHGWGAVSGRWPSDAA